jgi:hypothetical protein
MNDTEIKLDSLKSLIDKPKRIEQFSYEKEVGKWHLSSTYFELSEKPS